MIHDLATGYSQCQERIIKFQFRRNGLIHRAVVHDYQFVGDDTCRVTHPHETLCGLNIPIGTGGWGYGAKDCPRCVPT